MGACVSKLNAVGGAADAPESRDLKTKEEAVKREVETADEEAERRSLGYLFKENKGEVVSTEDEKGKSVVPEAKLDENGNGPKADASAKDEKEESLVPDAKNVDNVSDSKADASEKEKSPVADDGFESKSSEDVRFNVEPQEEKVDEKHGMAEGTRKETGEPALPKEKEAIEVKLAEIETRGEAEDEPAFELQITKPYDESVTKMKSETPAIQIEDQKPVLDEEKKESQASDPTSENNAETLEVKSVEEQRPDSDADTEKVEKLAVSSKAEETEEQEGMPPDKQEKEDRLDENSNMEASQQVSKPAEYREEGKQSDIKNPETERIEHQFAASVAEISKTQP